MTDLPQLQTQLVGAAVRRRRRRRARSVVVAAALLAAVPLLAREVSVPDREVPATTPRSVEDAFSVFRRPATAEERRAVPAGQDARRIGGSEAEPVYLVRRGPDLCLAVFRASGYAPDVCQPARMLVTGRTLLTARQGARLHIAFPDAVRQVTLTLPGGRPQGYRVGVYALPAIPGQAARLQWTAPDGTPREERFDGRGPATYWSRFWDVETPADRRDGLPGTRLLVKDGDVTAYLVPRRDAMCLLVYVANAGRSACRQNLADTRFPIVVSIDGTTVAAFPDTLEPMAPEASGVTRQRDAVVARPGTLETLRYRDRAGERADRLPDQQGFVLHARPMSPFRLMPG
jgi:hypothetical protein